MTNNIPERSARLIDLTAEIVAAFVSNNTVLASELSTIIADTHAAVSALQTGGVPPNVEKPIPAISIKKSLTPDFLICLEDGKRFKSLKRHLAAHYGLTPDAYRQKWNLPDDYPMVAPNYSATRSALAKATGLGRQPAAAQPVPAPARKRKKLGLKFG